MQSLTKVTRLEQTYLARSRDKDLAHGMIAFARTKYSDPEVHAAALQIISDDDKLDAEEEGRFIHKLMTPVEFLKHGLQKYDNMWPAVLPHYEELCSGEYVEAVLTGGIGTAKTTLAVFTQLYETYRILNLAHPHKEFDLDPASDIVVVFQSVTAGAARSVDYEFFRAIVDNAPWFQDTETAQYDPDLKSVLKFARNVTVRPVSSLETAAIGQNVIGGIIDEINYLNVIEGSRKALDGATYDQAQVNYNAIARRRESRFMHQGFLAGMLCLVSSKRYPGQFTDRKVAQADAELRQTGETRIYVYDKRVWEVRPEGSYGDARFKVFIGERHLNPYIIPVDQEDQYDDDDPLVDTVPSEYLHSYEEDIHAALRDISGVSSQLQNAYFTNMEVLSSAFGNHKSIFNTETSNFIRPVLSIRPKLFIDPEKPHYAHVDLGATADSAGLCVGHVDRFVQIERTNGTVEDLPLIVIDGILEIPPPRGGEIDFAKIRSIFYRLRELGMNLRWVSYDSWQSRDSLQLLKNQGFTVGTLSLDRDTKGYDLTKQAFNDSRIIAPVHDKCEQELRNLQWFRDKDKIDHLPDGSKDCSDALAGCVYGLTIRRELWVNANVVPRTIELVTNANKDERV